MVSTNAIDTLRSIRELGPCALLEDAFWDDSERILGDYACEIPAYYFECRLGASRSPQTDLLFGVMHGQEVGLEAARGRMAWLEFDDVGATGSTRPPCSSVCLVEDYQRWSRIAYAPDPALQLELGRRVMAALGRGEREPLAGLERCLAAEGGCCIHISVMAGRPTQPVKLYCQVVRSKLRELLTQSGWRGPLAEIEALVAEYFDPRWSNEHLYLDLVLDDLERDGGSRLGLVFPQQYLVGDGDPQRRELLAQLEARGLCTPAQARALAAWPGRSLTKDGLRVVTKFLDLKLVWHPDEPLALKAYLGAAVRNAGMFD